MSGDVARFTNRELSWLEFNERVLAISADPDTPLLERAKFLAIFGSNLDEFFQVRVSGLKDQLDSTKERRSPDGLTPAEQLAAIHQRVSLLTRRAEGIFLNEIVPGLADAGVQFSSWDQLDPEDRTSVSDTFDRRIYGVLTPLAVDPSHPFPQVSNLSLNLAVTVADGSGDEHRFARVKIPRLLPRFLLLPGSERFVAVEQVIAAHLGRLFEGMDVVEHASFRVTRDADLDLVEDEADDLLEAMEIEVRRRRFGRAVRLEVSDDMSAEALELLTEELEVGPDDVYRLDAPVDLTGLFSVYDLNRPDLKFAPHRPVTTRRLTIDDGSPADFFSVIRRGDLLFHHPYDSFTTSVEEFVRQASDDPDVQAIKMTMYRAGGDSEIVNNLIDAAERGIQVAVLVELKARFDEENNIGWARRLEEAGVHVAYGLAGLKTHAKITLVARAESDGIHRYCHIGTGNYNAKTARTYEDMGLLTADPEIVEDVGRLFNVLTGYGRGVHYRRLLVAPEHLRPGLRDLIRREAAAGSAGRITLKMNSLADPELIDELYAASSAGVRVQLVIRGICCLRPGVAGLSENVQVRSIVGQFLEHSRVFRFGNADGPGRARTYIGSADVMGRNLDGRVEALVPVTSPHLRDRLDMVLEMNLRDDTRAWELRDRTYLPPVPGGTVDAQHDLAELARAMAEHR